MTNCEVCSNELKKKVNQTFRYYATASVNIPARREVEAAHKWKVKAASETLVPKQRDEHNLRRNRLHMQRWMPRKQRSCPIQRPVPATS
jgi:hypothetical protein